VEYEMGNEKALEAGPLERLFGNVALAKILDFMVTFQEWDYSKMDIAKNSGVSFRHVLRELPKLEKLEIIRQTRTVGRAIMYQYNNKTSTGQAVKNMIFTIGAYEADKMAREEIAKEETAKEKAKAETITA
jgi:hypothetical protein